MHELGHDLKLFHGGRDPTQTYKPNYLSVMNHAFTKGLIIDGTGYHLDYSRFSSSDIPDMVQTALVEVGGLNGSAAVDRYGTFHLCVAGETEELQRVERANEDIDWDCDAEIDAAPYAATTPLVGGSHPSSIIRSYNDWEDLRFHGNQVIGRHGAVNYPVDPPDDEPTGADLDLIPAALDLMVLGPGAAATLSQGGSTTYEFRVANVGEIADTYTLEAMSSEDWAETAMVPESVALLSGEETVVGIQVVVPQNASDGEVDELELTATSQINPLLLDSASTRTTVPEPGFLLLQFAALAAVAATSRRRA